MSAWDSPAFIALRQKTCDSFQAITSVSEPTDVKLIDFDFIYRTQQNALSKPISGIEKGHPTTTALKSDRWTEMTTTFAAPGPSLNQHTIEIPTSSSAITSLPGITSEAIVVPDPMEIPGAVSDVAPASARSEMK